MGGKKKKGISNLIDFATREEIAIELTTENGLKEKTLFEENAHVMAILLQLQIKKQDFYFKIWEKIFYQIENSQENTHIYVFYAIKNENCMLIWMISDVTLEHEKIMKKLNSKILEILQNEYSYYLVAGQQQKSIQLSYKSYQSAVIQLQYCIYKPYGLVYVNAAQKTRIELKYEKYQNRIDSFLLALHDLNKETCNELANKLYSEFVERQDILARDLREMYMNLFFEIHKECEHYNLKMPENNWMCSKCTCYLEVFSSNIYELHIMLKESLILFFAGIKENNNERIVVTMVKRYIEKNYSNDDISLKMISNYARISVSYLSMLFKKETGCTINKYQTMVRMQEAKRFLKDPRYNVTEVCELVGYKEVSYFGKIFKKMCNMTPLEYREKGIFNQHESKILYMTKRGNLYEKENIK